MSLIHYVVFLRGINVGGKNILRMEALVQILEGLGCGNVRTYIQSGNVALTTAGDPDQLSRNIGVEISTRHGFEPDVLILGLHELQEAIRLNPYPESESDPKSLHLGFLKSAPQNPDEAALESLKNAGEQFRVLGKVFYLSAPDGIGKSKLAARAERVLGISMTSRNWRTVMKMQELAGSES
jgi:uncharacterized protein (DUF1697 family)